MGGSPGCRKEDKHNEKEKHKEKDEHKEKDKNKAKTETKKTTKTKTKAIPMIYYILQLKRQMNLDIHTLMPIKQTNNYILNL